MKRLLALSIIFIAIIAAVIYFVQPFKQETFYSIKLIELLQLSASVFIALIIGMYINQINSYDIKRKEILYNFLNNLQTVFEDLYDSSNEYITKRDAEDKSKVTKGFKNASSLISNLLQLKKHSKLSKCIKVDDEFVSDFLSLKASITDTPFGTNNAYSADSLINIDIKYQSLYTKLYNYKLDLYI